MNNNEVNENGEEKQHNLKWNTCDDDVILKEWADKSACFKWLHEKSYKKYKKDYLHLMIPVIVISTLTGAANFALQRIPDTTYQGYASLIVGTFNIVAAIISTIAQFLKTAELKEGHNIAAKSWDKFNRSIKIELLKNPLERTNKHDLFTYSIKEYDRLVELSPDIPTFIITEFKGLYKDSLDLIKPEITGFIMSSKIYEKKVEENLNKDFYKLSEDDEVIKKNIFIEEFKKKYSRMPTNDEIVDHIELSNVSNT